MTRSPRPLSPPAATASPLTRSLTNKPGLLNYLIGSWGHGSSRVHGGTGAEDTCGEDQEPAVASTRNTFVRSSEP